MNPKPFQEATVQHVVNALASPKSSRRFLVADEVGLGKTRVAQGVIEALCETQKHLEVFYVCSSLSIIHQNRDALLDNLSPEDQKRARVDVDRLTLLPTTRPSRTTPFTLYTLTPGTLPSGRRTGRADERAVIWELLRRSVDGVTRQGTLNAVFRRSVGSWEEHVENAANSVTNELASLFRSELATIVELGDAPWSSTLIQRMKGMAKRDDADLIGKCRSALARAALKKFSPDLIILDEFQRFFDTIIPDEKEAEEKDKEAHDIVDRLLGIGLDKSPAILMLSATPYPLYSGWTEGAHGHYEQFLRLARFLFGAKRRSELQALEQDLHEYSDLLKSESVGSKEVFSIRDRVSNSLARIMTRTERPSTVAGKRRLAFDQTSSPVAVEDIQLFRHLLDATTEKQDRSAATSYWASIPYPLQMMDNGYKLFERSKPKPLKLDTRSACLYWRQIRRYESISHPHPKLRALLELAPPSLLVLPWLPPTKPWWALGGQFAKAVQKQESFSKKLVFSRFRATPRAIAATLSYEAERAVFSPLSQREKGVRPTAYEYRTDKGAKPLSGLKRRPSASFSFPLASKQETAMRSLLMFVPLPALADLGDPLPLAAGQPQCTLETVLRTVESRLKAILGQADIQSREQTAWSWVAQIERTEPSWGALKEGVEAWMAGGDLDDEDSPSQGIEKATRRLLAAERPMLKPAARDLRELAEIAVLAPGNVLYRAVKRVFGATKSLSARIKVLARVSVGPLRTYLDHPDFHLAFRDKLYREHPGAIRKAVWDGNLESVLDEYLAVRRGLGVDEPRDDIEERVLASLTQALSVGTVSVRVHETGKEAGNEIFSMRCHAALPFGLSATEVETEKGTFRPDDLRHAFNSPFRPHVLATTSIGQEGLDFHVWCNHIVHWDLPSNPVDLEQREGRIDRYAGLAVRRALSTDPFDLPSHESPWLAIANRQKPSRHGMSPWWITQGSEIRRSVLIPALSKMEDDLARLKRELSLYRMALGQADQESLIRALHRRLSEQGDDDPALLTWLDKARIDLSPPTSRRD